MRTVNASPVVPEELNPILIDIQRKGVEFVDITFTAQGDDGTNSISHGLGGIPTGWSVIDIDQHATVRRRKPSTDSHVYLASSVHGARITVRVYK